MIAGGESLAKPIDLPQTSLFEERDLRYKQGRGIGLHEDSRRKPFPIGGRGGIAESRIPVNAGGCQQRDAVAL